MPRRLLVILGSVLVVPVGIGLYGYWSMRHLLDSEDSVVHTHEASYQLSELLSLLKDAEAGQRGFLVTGDRAYLQPYTDAVAAVGGLTDKVRDLTADNPGQQERLTRLQRLIVAKLTVTGQAIAAYDRDGPDAAARVVKSDVGRLTMDAIRAQVQAMEAEERDLLAARMAHSQQLRERGSTLLAAAIGLSIIALIAAGVALQRYQLRRMSIEEEDVSRRIVDRAEAVAMSDFGSADYDSFDLDPLPAPPVHR
jgi:CHASE3 domain sensor protein